MTEPTNLTDSAASHSGRTHYRQTRYRRLTGGLLAGGAATILILAVLLPLHMIFKTDFAPANITNRIIETTPPDNAIQLQNALGSLSMPSAVMGGIMFTAMFGMVAGLVFTLIRPFSRPLALLVAAVVAPGLIAAAFPSTANTFVALAPLALIPLVTSWLTRHDDRPVPVEKPQIGGLSRRDLLGHLALFSLGGLALATVNSFSTVSRDLQLAGNGLRKLFNFTPPAARKSGFDVAGLTPEVTPVDQFYYMRKFTTPIPENPPDWVLTVDGLVGKPLKLNLSDLQALGKYEDYLTRQCVSNPVGGPLMSTALMTGVSLKSVLQSAGVRPEATTLIFYGRDGYEENIDLPTGDAIAVLVYAMNGFALPERHGAPVRVEMPGFYGFKSLKWLDRIEVTDRAHQAVWEQQGWARAPQVKTTARIDTTQPTAEGTVIAGVAFAGRRGVSRVEVQVNAQDWQDADLHTDALNSQTWVQWRYETTLKGKLSVAVRATDGGGDVQSETVRDQFPDGAQGYHTREFTV